MRQRGQRDGACGRGRLVCARARTRREGSGKNKEAREGGAEEKKKKHKEKKSKPGSRGGGHRARGKNIEERIQQQPPSQPVPNPERDAGSGFGLFGFGAMDGWIEGLYTLPRLTSPARLCVLAPYPFSSFCLLVCSFWFPPPSPLAPFLSLSLSLSRACLPGHNQLSFRPWNRMSSIPRTPRFALLLIPFLPSLPPFLPTYLPTYFFPSLSAQNSLEAQLPGIDERPFGRKAPGRERERERWRERGRARETGGKNRRRDQRNGRERQGDEGNGGHRRKSGRGLRSMGVCVCARVCKENHCAHTHTHTHTHRSRHAHLLRVLHASDPRLPVARSCCSMSPSWLCFFPLHLVWCLTLSLPLPICLSVSVWRVSPSRIVFSKIPSKSVSSFPWVFFFSHQQSAL